MDPFKVEDGDMALVEGFLHVPPVSTVIRSNVTVMHALIGANRTAENFTLPRPTMIVGMVNHNQESYDFGYDSDGNMPILTRLLTIMKSTTTMWGML